MKYSTTEERWNVITHAFGALASIPATIALLAKATNSSAIIAVIIFGLSLFMLYLASTSYHASRKEATRLKLRIFDHAAIFILIAGTYTPICVISLKESVGTLLLVIIWVIAGLGVTLKLFFTGKYDRASTISYVVMGWIALGAINPLLDALEVKALLWLLAGGICYTLGAIVYRFHKIPFNHAAFHVFVLAGSAAHYVMIYQFIL